MPFEAFCIPDYPKIQRYFVEANNGWKPDCFIIDLSQQGRTLSMVMSSPDSPNLGEIRAKFVRFSRWQGREATRPA